MTNWTLSVGLEGSLGNLPSVLNQGATLVQNFGRVTEKNLTGIRASFAGLRGELGQTLFSSRWVADNEANLSRAGGAVAGFGAVVLAGLGFAAKAAMDWESAWAGVVKTTDATVDQLPALERQLRSLTEVLPASHEEIAAVAEAAGQLGIKSKDVVGFTRVMIDLGESTNVTSDQAATAIAQISNVFGSGFPISQVENFGSAVVALGNSSATTESQILDISQRMAGMAQVAGMSIQDVLGFSSAVASVGVQSEIGGSSMSRIIAAMSKAVQTGKQDLETYAQVAGVSADEFATAWENRPAEAIVMFTQGLDRMNQEGGNTVGVLSELRLGAVGTSQVLLSLAGSGDLLTDSLALSAEAWEKNSALAEEAGKRYETTESRIAIARNQFNDLGITLGTTLLPVLGNVADGLADVFSWFADMPDSVQRIITLFGTLVGVASVLGGGFLMLVPRIVATRAAMQSLATQMPKTTAAMRGVGRTAGIVAGLMAVGAAIQAVRGDGQDLEGSASKWSVTLRQFADGSGVLADMFKDLDLNFAAEGAMNFQESLAELSSPSFLSRIDQGAEAILSALNLDFADSDFDKFEGRMAGIGEGLANLAADDLPTAQAAFRALAAETDGTESSLQNLLSAMPAYEESLWRTAEAQNLNLTESQMLALAMGDLATAGLSAEQSAAFQQAAFEETAKALGMTAEQYQAAQDAAAAMVDAVSESVSSFVDVNGTFTGMLEDGEDAWAEYKDGVSASIDELNAKLAEQVEAQANWATNIMSLSGTMSSETIGYLQSLGAEGAPLVQQLFNELAAGNMDALAQFDANVQQMVGTTPDAMADVMIRATPLIREVAATQGQEAANALAAALMNGQTTVEMAAAELGMVLEMMPDGTYRVVADTTEADNAIAGITAGATVPITADINRAKTKADEFFAYAESTEPLIICDAETGAASLSVDAFRVWVEGLDPQATVIADTDEATGAVEAFVTWSDGSRSEVTVDATTDGAQTAITTLLDGANASGATVDVFADTAPGWAQNTSFLDQINGASGTVSIFGNSAAGQGTLGAFTGQVNASSGTVGIGGNSAGAYLALGAVVGAVNQSKGSVGVSTTKAAGWWSTVSSVLSSINSQTAYIRVGTVKAFAGGGGVHGPGTGTSDSIPAWLSNGEHVWTDREVRAAGGHGAIYRLREMALAGTLRFRDGGAVAPTYPGVSLRSQPTVVNVTAPEAAPSTTQIAVAVDVEDLRGLRTVLEFADMIDVKTAQKGSRR